jgi:hypothetical protein
LDVFEYLGVLVSVVIGLAITHLVSGTNGLIQERDKTRVFWVHQVWVLNIFLYLATFWWFFFGWASLEAWSMGVYWLLLGYALVLSLLAGILYPSRRAAKDFEEYFFRGFPEGAGRSACRADGLFPLHGRHLDRQCPRDGHAEHSVSWFLRGVLARLATWIQRIGVWTDRVGSPNWPPRAA